MNSTKTTLGLLSLLLATALYSNSLLANQPRGDRNKPPQEAIDACIDKVEGDIVTFTTRRGDELTAECKVMEDVLIAVPEGHENHQRPDPS